MRMENSTKISKCLKTWLVKPSTFRLVLMSVLDYLKTYVLTSSLLMPWSTLHKMFTPPTNSRVTAANTTSTLRRCILSTASLTTTSSTLIKGKLLSRYLDTLSSRALTYSRPRSWKTLSMILAWMLKRKKLPSKTLKSATWKRCPPERSLKMMVGTTIITPSLRLEATVLNAAPSSEHGKADSYYSRQVYLESFLFIQINT